MDEFKLPKNSFTILIILILAINIIFAGCLKEEANNKENIIKEGKNGIQDSLTNKSEEKEKISLGEIVCRFENKEIKFHNAISYVDENKTYLKAENDKYRFVMEIPWDKKGKYGYQKDKEEEVDLNLFEKKKGEGNLYTLNYDDNYNLFIEEYENYFKGKVKANLAVLGKWNDSYKVECEFYSKWKTI